MNPSLILLIGAATGLLIGAGLGYVARRGTAAPNARRSPVAGALLGAIVGVAGGSVVISAGRGRASAAALASLETVAGVENFDTRVLRAERPVLVKFATSWCGVCKALAPTIVELADEYKGRADVVMVDGDDSPELVGRYNVPGYPTVLVFAGGKLIGKSLVGRRAAGEYRSVLDAAIAAMERKTE